MQTELMQVEQRLASQKPVLEKLTGRPATDAAVRAFLDVDWEHLYAMLAALRKQFGSVEGYVEQVLGLDERTVEQIRWRLLVSV
jgi:protein-tyrosine phosphatase